ncbi:hypothetical protein FACS189428_5490 [Clostridia bacterium]|nr:hypothetical protein FACS189428_5490 [Clostridia bacterium]
MLKEEKKISATRLIIQGISELVVKPSSDEFVKIEQAPKSLEITDSNGTLTLKGKGGGNGNRVNINGKDMTFLGDKLYVNGKLYEEADGKKSGVGKKSDSTQTILGGFLSKVLNSVISSSSNVTVIGSYSQATINGRSIKIVGNNIYVNGKLMRATNSNDKEEEKPESPKVVILVPKGIECQIKGCKQVNLEDEVFFSKLNYDGDSHSKLQASSITADSAKISLDGMSKGIFQKLTVYSRLHYDGDGHSTLQISSVETQDTKFSLDGMSKGIFQNLTAVTLTIDVDGHSEVEINGGEIKDADLEADGMSKITLQGKLTDVKADADGHSTIRYSKPANTPIISEDGMGRCKVL